MRFIIKSWPIMHNLEHIIQFLVNMLVMINPLSGLSIFLSLTKTAPLKLTQDTAKICGLAVWVTMIIIVWIGGPLLDFLGVSIAAFRCAGGIILFLMGLSMLQSQQSPTNYTAEEKEAASEKESIAIVPLALPILVGPGVISTIITENEDYTTLSDKFIFSVLCTFLAIIIFLILYFSKKISKTLGPSVIKVITRIMGMIVTARAAEMLANGLIGLIPALQKISS